MARPPRQRGRERPLNAQRDAPPRGAVLMASGAARACPSDHPPKHSNHLAPACLTNP